MTTTFFGSSWLAHMLSLQAQGKLNSFNRELQVMQLSEDDFWAMVAQMEMEEEGAEHMTTLLNWMSMLNLPNVDYTWYNPHGSNTFKVKGCSLLLSAMICKDSMDDIFVQVFTGKKPNDILVFVNFGNASEDDFPLEKQKVYTYESGSWEEVTI